MIEKRNIVAISSDFLTAFSKIPKNQQAKVLDFISKFRKNPLMPGIHYEKIQHSKDPNLRSVRIDKSHRGIVFRAKAGNVFMLLWVDHHDRAYQWAKNKVIKVHPELGSIQVFEVSSEDRIPPEIDKTKKEKFLFSDIKDKDLLKLGVPEDLIPMVRNIKDETELDQLSYQLPEEAYEALFFLASGFSLDEIYRELGIQEKETPINTEDFEKALTDPNSKRRFYVVEEELELASILNAPLEKWRVFLHPSQRSLVERNWNGPVRVLGGAGTGKTVVAMHRAKWLAENVLNGENEKILFTTFSRNLAEDIKENLRKICKEEILKKIEVVNLDKWVSDFLRRNGYDFEIDYGKRSNTLWEKALDLAPEELNLPPSFYREEWERVIQPQSITTLSEYLKAQRIGRGIRLSRKARKLIWPVFEEYRILLKENGLKEPDDAMRDARILLENKGDILPYRSIIVDEAQDMGEQAFRLLRQMIPGGDKPNDLFIVGDAHQRIYRHRVVLSHCGINIRGRSKKLKINYRTTEENRKWAIGLLEGLKFDDLDGGIDDQKGYKSLLHGIEPKIKNFNTFNKEISYIIKFLEEIKNNGEKLEESCLVVRTNQLLKQYENALNKNNIETYRIKRSVPEDRNAKGLRLATMHRVKGLEFNNIIIASVNKGVIPLERALKESSDPLIERETEIRERALIYVAVTRAKKEVLITSFGKPSKFLT